MLILDCKHMCVRARVCAHVCVCVYACMLVCMCVIYNAGIKTLAVTTETTASQPIITHVIFQYLNKILEAPLLSEHPPLVCSPESPP